MMGAFLTTFIISGMGALFAYLADSHFKKGNRVQGAWCAGLTIVAFGTLILMATSA